MFHQHCRQLLTIFHQHSLKCCINIAINFSTMLCQFFHIALTMIISMFRQYFLFVSTNVVSMLRQYFLIVSTMLYQCFVSIVSMLSRFSNDVASILSKRFQQC